MLRSPLDTIMRRRLDLNWDEPLDRRTITAYQLARLRETVEYARKRCPFYRAKLAAVKTEALTAEAALPLVPFTDEEELRQRGPDMLCVSQDEVARIITMQSSGTTGPAKRLFFAESDLAHTLEFFHLGMTPLVSPGERVLILLPGESPDSTGDLLSRALTGMEVDSRIYGLIGDPARAAKEIFGERYDAIVGFPVQILALARCCEEDISPQVRSVLLCSDYIPGMVEDILSRTWQCEVFSHYGTVETGLGGGVECEPASGCHLREADLLFEVVSPESGAPLPPGEWGEIVFTTLSRRAMPLIRYRTGDYGRLLPGTCGCGSQVRRLDKVRGRINQIRRLENGQTITIAELDETLLGVAGLLDYRVELHRIQNRDRLALTMTVMAGRQDSVLQDAASLLKGIARLEDIDVSLAIDPTGTICRGKRIIQDKRGTDHHEKAH